MFYIASPYTHESAQVRKARAYCTTVLTGELMRRIQHDWGFSPITHGHEVAQHLPSHVASDHGFWMRQCKQALAEATILFLLPLPGWEKSKGVLEELDYCQTKSLPVVYLNCKTWAMQHLRNGGRFNYRSPAEQEALKIWAHFAASPTTIKLPKWCWNWRVQELLELPLSAGEVKLSGNSVSYIITDEITGEEEEASK